MTANFMPDEPIDLSKMVPKYSDDATEKLKADKERLDAARGQAPETDISFRTAKDRLLGLEDFSFTYTGFFNAGNPVTMRYLTQRAIYETRLDTMRALSLEITRPLGFLNPRAEAQRRQRVFDTFTPAIQVELVMYNSYRRRYLN